MNRKMNGLLIIGLTATVFFGSFFASDYLEATRGSQDIWWTPMSMALSLDQSRPEFELYIKKDMLQKHIEKGRLLIADEQGKQAQVAADDIKVRLNNWHKVKADKMQYAIVTAFFLGASIVVMFMGLIRYFTDKK